MEKSKVSIIGTGYVGLTTAVCFSKLNFEVVCIDVDQSKVDMINSGKSPIFEEFVDEYLKDALKNGMIVTTDYSKIKDTDVSFICVPTPMSDDGSMDTKYLDSSAESIAKEVSGKEKHVVVIKSTVVPGTNRRVGELINSITKKDNVFMVSNPEFLQEGKAIKDFMEPDRIIIGGDDESLETVAALYKDIDTEILKTNLETAEMIKYVSNTFLATKISFINEIANLVEKIPGVNVDDIAKGVGLDARVSPKFLRPGVGYGGSCFPKDIKALIKFAKDNNLELNIPLAAEKINDIQPLRAISLLKEEAGNLSEAKIGILGTAFKPETDDIREAPSNKIIQNLLDQNANVFVYDPVAMENTKSIFGDKIEYKKSSKDLIESSDNIILLTEWKEFSEIPFESFSGKVLIDGRRVFAGKNLKNIRYRTIGGN